jgi:hypothetical protein
MTTDRTNQTITLKDGQVRSKPSSYTPEGRHTLHIHLCYCKFQNHDDLYGSFDHDSDGFH